MNIFLSFNLIIYFGCSKKPFLLDIYPQYIFVIGNEKISNNLLLEITSGMTLDESCHALCSQK